MNAVHYFHFKLTLRIYVRNTLVTAKIYNVDDDVGHNCPQFTSSPYYHDRLAVVLQLFVAFSDCRCPYCEVEHP